MTVVNIPAGPGNEKGMRRLVELEKIHSPVAIALVDRRHTSDAHPDLRGYLSNPNCYTCIQISRRAFKIYKSN